MNKQLKPLIQFSHANGFPGSTYQQLYKQLGNEVEIDYIDVYAQENSPYLVTNNWPQLVDQLINRVCRHGRKVIAVGHSLGGVLSLFACNKRPDLFSKVIMLDAPYFSFPKRLSIKLAKIFGFTSILTPGGSSVLSRKRIWDSQDHVISYLKTKALFKNFTEECLADWASYATLQLDDGRRRLKISPEIKYSIYGTLPDISVNRGALNSVEIHAIIGKSSRLISSLDTFIMNKIYGIKIHSMPGGHMFPFEWPKDTADIIRKIVAQQ